MKTLELPELGDLNLSLSPKTNASLDRTQVRPTNWDNTIAQQYEVGKSIDTTGWTYATNFSKLNMYEGWSYVCQCCNEPIRQCVNNETLHFTAIQWQEYYKTMSTAILEQNPEQIEDQAIPVRTRRSKGSFAQTVSDTVSDNILADYAKGATITSLANQYMIATPVVRDFLESNNVLRGRGQSLNRKSTRVRNTLIITDAIVEQAMGMYQEMGGVVNTAKALNVNAVELSAALKAKGAVINRGRKAKAKA